MAGQVLKVHLTSRIFDCTSLLEDSEEVSTAGIISSQLVDEFKEQVKAFEGKTFSEALQGSIYYEDKQMPDLVKRT